MKTIKRYTASWCAPCKGLAMIIEGMDLSIPVEVVDIDKNQEEAIAAGIRSVPTLIMFEDGVEIKRSVGVLTETQLTEWINNG